MADNGEMGGVCGSLFQVKLLMLFLLKGLTFNDDFDLGTEIKEAKKFDDLVFKYKKPSKNKKEIDHFCILQAKHKMDADEKIKIGNLLTMEDVPFGLVKYFFSFKGAKLENLFKNGIIEHAVVYTNASLDLTEVVHSKDENLKKIQNLGNITEEYIPEKDSILTLYETDTHGKYYRFRKDDSLIATLKTLIVKYEYYKLAKTLIVALMKRKILCHKDPYLTKYHIFLAKEVIDVQTCYFQSDFFEVKCEDFAKATDRQKLRMAFDFVQTQKEVTYINFITKNNCQFRLSNGFGKRIDGKIKKQCWLRGDIKLFNYNIEDRREICDRNLRELSLELLDCLLEKKKIDRSQRVFSEFYELLMKYVFDLSKNEFKADFIQSDHEPETKEEKGLYLFKMKMLAEMKYRNLDFHSLNDYLATGKMSIAFMEHKKSTEHSLFIEDDIDNDIEVFLDTLKFAVDQPDEKKLEEMIRSYLKMKYPLYDGDFMYSYFFKEMLNWMKGDKFINNETRNRFISFNVAKDFIENTILKFDKLLLKDPTVQYNEYIKLNQIRFEDRQLKNILIEFKSSAKNILNITTEHIVVTSIKVYQLLTDETNYEEMDVENMIYTRLSDLIKSPSNFAVNKMIEKHIVLLIIENDLDGSDLENITDQCRELSSNVVNNMNKIIVIGKHEHVFSVQLKQQVPIDHYKEIEDMRTNFPSLSAKSQNFLLQKNVKFQGFDVKFHDIVNDNLREKIDGNILLKLFTDGEIQILEKIKEMDDLIGGYINRTFFRVLKNSEEVYLISDISETDFYNFKDQKINNVIKNTSNIVLTVAESEFFNSTYNENKWKKIILLRKENNKLIILKEKNGTVQVGNENEKKTVINNLKSDLFLISAVAGMGKSTTFTQLTFKMKQYEPSLLVLKICLNSLSAKLKEISNMNRKMEKTVALDFLFYSVKTNSEFEKHLFSHFLQNQKMILLFDGFDEICPNYKMLTIDLIKTIRQEAKIKQIWISTRPYDSILKDIKITFGYSFYMMDQFSTKDQINFLTKYWKNCFKSNFNEELCTTFILILMDVIMFIINDNRMEFLGIALHTVMVAKTLKDTFEKFNMCQNVDKNEELFRKEIEKMLKLSVLYQNFIHIKFYEACYYSKVNLNLDHLILKEILDSDFQKFYERNQILSLGALFDENVMKFLLTEDQIEKLDSYKSDIEKSGDRVGIIYQIVDGTPYFVHRTFAEYFVADFFIRAFSKKNKKTEQILYYFLDNFSSEENEIICHFMDGKLSNEIIKNLDRCSNENRKINSSFLEKTIEKKWRKLTKILISRTDLADEEFNITKLTISNEDCDYEDIDDNMLKTVFEQLKKISNPKINVLRDYLFNTDLENRTSFWFQFIIRAKIDNIIIIFEICKELDIHHNLLTMEYNGENIIHQIAYNPNLDTVKHFFELSMIEPEKLKQMLLRPNSEGELPLIYVAKRINFENNFKVFIDVYKKLQILEDALKYKNFEDDNLIYQVFHFFHLKSFKCLFDLLKLDLKTLKRELCSLLLINDRSTDIEEKLEYAMETCPELNVLDILFSNEDYEGNNLLHLTSSNFYYDSYLNFLLERLKINPEKLKQMLVKTNRDGYTPIHIAAKYGNEKKLKSLSETCKELSILKDVVVTENIFGGYILHFNSFNFTTYYADPDFLNRLICILRLFPEELKIMLLKNDSKNNIPLMSVFKYGNINCIKNIIELYRNMYILENVLAQENLKGETLLHLSVKNDYSGVTIYISNVLRDYPEILNGMLLKRDVNGNIPLMMALQNCDCDAVQVLLQLYRDFQQFDDALKCSNSDEKNLMHFAVRNINYDIMEIISNFSKCTQECMKSLLLDTDIDGNIPMMVSGKWRAYNIKVMVEMCQRFGIFETIMMHENLKGQNILHVLYQGRGVKDLEWFLSQLKVHSTIFNKMLTKSDVYGNITLMYAIRDHRIEKDMTELIMAYYERKKLKSSLLIINKEKKNIFHLASDSYRFSDSTINFLLNKLKRIHPKTLKKLIYHCDRNGNTLLMNSLENDAEIFLENISYLIGSKDSYQILNLNKQNIVHVLMKNRRPKNLHPVINHMKNNPQILTKMLLKCDRFGNTPLILSAKKFYFDDFLFIVDIYREFGIFEKSLLHKNFDGQNITHFKAHNEFIPWRFFFELFETDLNILKKMLLESDRFGYTPLMVAAVKGIKQFTATFNVYKKLEISENVFLEHIFDVDSFLCTKYITFFIKESNITQELLKTALSKTDSNGNTVLSIAAENNTLLDLRIIVETYQNMNIFQKYFFLENLKGQNIYHSAALNSNHDVIKYLAHLGKTSFPTNDELTNVKNVINLDVLRKMLLNPDHNGHIPLMIAAKYERFETVKRTMETYEEFHIFDKIFAAENYERQNIAHIAATSCHPTVVNHIYKKLMINPEKFKELLLNSDCYGCTPIMVAEDSRNRQNINIVTQVYQKLRIL